MLKRGRRLESAERNGGGWQSKIMPHEDEDSSGPCNRRQGIPGIASTAPGNQSGARSRSFLTVLGRKQPQGHLGLGLLVPRTLRQ